ncbi:unnamed protein product [Cuscuta campestris]|uniref:Uncharacterized protein n=1 Tax=Cuscuta campestris TaxID=132261 RepID=A0A484MDK8_9ASTE|nr:unnamed protein product [Cuscuta campestris]
MEKNPQKVSNPSAKKKTPSKYSNSSVRRSCRLQKLGSPVRSELAAEKIDLTAEETPQAQLIDSGYSEEQVGITPLVHEMDNGDDEKHVDEQVSMEEKIDFLYRTSKEPKKSKVHFFLYLYFSVFFYSIIKLQYNSNSRTGIQTPLTEWNNV